MADRNYDNFEILSVEGLFCERGSKKGQAVSVETRGAQEMHGNLRHRVVSETSRE